MFERAKFYSIDDLGNNLELTRAEEILEAYDEGKEFGLEREIKLAYESL